MVEIILGITYSSFLEYYLHKIPLHNWGGVFRDHVLIHHRLSAKNMIDNEYKDVVFGKNEIIVAFIIFLFHLPLVFFYKFFYFSVVFYTVLYLVLHRISHINSIFAKKWMPWHYIHHCVNSKKNFGIVHPIIDILLGTYKK
jgi:sterol desaturase/sphingolipid hydroxylase (fatty acid hydroxylase superfamily)